jgi:glycosyltransferase involved in cell wall biosynthesis
VLKTLANSNLPRVVYAHDLYCAVAALLIMPTPNARLIYDSHELQIHRHRKLGRLRILIEYGLEQRILRHANEVRTVNQAISTVMMDLYQIPATVRVEYNDHYTHHSPGVPSISDRPALVFVGKGLRGRQLEVLDRSSVELGFDVHAYLLGTRLPISISGRYWHYGPEKYEEHLLALARSRRSMMWCCVDTTSMSYKLATPNKFFQALAMGIPIIASKGTYLAEIVHKYGIGAVFNGTNLPAISRQVMSPLYTQWVSGTKVFRVQLRSGERVI